MNEWGKITNADASGALCGRPIIKQHAIMLCGMYKNAEQAQLILILYQDGKRERSK